MNAVFECGTNRVCSLRNVFIDIWGEVPAEIGDAVMRVDWDDGGICMLASRVYDVPTLGRDINGLMVLGFDKNQEIGAPWYMKGAS